MSDEPPDPPEQRGIVLVAQPPNPVVVLTRIGQIATYEVMQDELEQLDQMVAAENKALGFLSLSVGVFFTAVTAWASASSLSAIGHGLYAAATMVFGMSSAWNGLTWTRERKRRPLLIARIRNRGVVGP